MDLVEWWNERIPTIENRIREVGAEPYEPESVWSWGQLVWQELVMWNQIGKPVNNADMDFMIRRRSFTPYQRDFLIEGLTHLKLWDPEGPGEAGELARPGKTELPEEAS
jgi:hypothetical protein